MSSEGFKLPHFISENSIDEDVKRKEELGLAKNDETIKDRRTLYERLQEQRQLKEEALLEANKLANRIHKIDEEESAFLMELIEKEKKRKLELVKEESEAVEIFKKEVKLSNKMELKPPVPKEEIPTSFAINRKQKMNSNKLGSKITHNNLIKKKDEDKVNIKEDKKEQKKLNKEVDTKPLAGLIDYDSDDSNDDN